MASVKVYKNGIELGSGSINSASTSLTSYSATASRPTGTGRWVQVTSGGNTMQTRVETDGGATLTLRDAWPF